MSTTAWVMPPAPAAAPPPVVDLPAALLAEYVREVLRTVADSSPRSRQAQIGTSEIGSSCDRQVAYKLLGVPPVNFPDPLRAMVGSMVHEGLAAIWRRLAEESGGRFLVEEHVVYRDIPGTCDLFDRRTHRVIDWKTTTKAKVANYRRTGPPRRYVVQVNGYAAALRERGEEVREVALAWVPVDGTLADVWTWVTPVDTTVIDAEIDRSEAIRDKATRFGLADVAAHPDRLCDWCDHLGRGSTDIARACPGTTEGA